MPDRRCVDDLTIEELEQVLLIKRREARRERLRRYADLGWLSEEAPILSEESERRCRSSSVVVSRPATITGRERSSPVPFHLDGTHR